MNGEKILSALIGLMGAVSNNEKTEQTDNLVRKALLHIQPLSGEFTSVKNSSDSFLEIDSSSEINSLISEEEFEDEIVRLLHEEKFRISPDCAVCQSPCGNTSDYDMQRFYQEPPETQELKLQLLTSVQKYASISQNELPEFIYQGITYLGLDLETEYYPSLIHQINDKLPALLKERDL